VIAELALAAVASLLILQSLLFLTIAMKTADDSSDVTAAVASVSVAFAHLAPSSVVDSCSQPSADGE
jgi:hypothetical protein